MTPRYKPTWGPTEGRETFIGYAGLLDVYYEHVENLEEEWLIVVGPPERKRRDNTSYNYDVFVVEDATHLDLQGDEPDLHIELHEMCEVIAKGVELKLLSTE